MARRKRQFLDDDDDDDSDSGASSEGGVHVDDDDPDVRAERALLDDPYNRKKRRKVGGKHDATYGVFGDDSEDEGFGGRPKAREKRSDWTKAPAFVSGDTVKSTATDQPDSEEEEEDEPEEHVSGDEETDGTGSSSPPPEPRIREEEPDIPAKPLFSGLGIKRNSDPTAAPGEPSPSKGGIGPRKGGISSNNGDTGSSKGGIGTRKGGIGSGNGGIGSSRSAGAPEDFPPAFGAGRPQRSFVRDDGTSDSSRPITPVPLSASERTHFNKIQGTFGARMLAKMGWEAGTGLGTSGEGIVTPIEAKLRPKSMGIAFKGFKEKTEQSKAEARRRGEVVTDDEDEKKPRGKGRSKSSKQPNREDAWKKPKRSKVKVEHKTYEEILAEAGEDAPPPGIGKIIDATGATLREVSSLADVSMSSWTPSTDPLRIPEVRHNLRLIADACKGDLDGLAKEAKALEARKKWARDEDLRLRRKIDEEADLIKRLQGIHLVMDDVNEKAREAATSDYEPSLEQFSGPIDKLLAEFPREFERYRLDEIVVAAIAPIMRRMMTSWKPLEDPAAFTNLLRKWKGALKMNIFDKKAQTQVDIYGTATVAAEPMCVDLPMTPYESLLWNVWLPRVRSCINNEWDPRYPHPIVQLYEAWSDIVPPFVRDNLMDQLILPKVSSTVANWNARKEPVSLQAIVFPWLPHVGLRVELFIDEARRKVKSMLRSWVVNDGVPKDLLAWKDVYKAGEWEGLLLKYVVPKLGATLREDFRVNPRNQNMEPLQQVMPWGEILRSSIFGQLLETEFFPKWLDILHFWLIQPKTNLEEVAQWYLFWRKSFPENIQNIPAFAEGFDKGLKLMNQAIDLGPDAPAKLPKPDHTRREEAQASVPPNKDLPRTRPSRTYEITFRSIVEEYISEHNLLFLPAGKVEEKSRLPLFRVAKTVDGKGGLLVYLLDDAVWALDGDSYRAISLENMVLRAIQGN